MNAALLTLAVAVTIAAPVPKEKKANYFPTAVGTKWEYEATEYTRAGTVKTEETQEVAEVVVGKDGASTVRVETRTKGQKRVVSYKMRVTDAGVWSTEYMGGGVIDPPQQILKLPLKDGSKWEYEERGREVYTTTVTAGAAEEVTTPAGKFTAVPITVVTQSRAGKYESKFWYADGVGLVKSTSGGKVVRDLKSFTPGKGDVKAEPKKDK